MNLYVSFTLMSLLETLAFLSSSHVRRETDHYEFFLEEKRNPRILAPKIVSILLKIRNTTFYKATIDICIKLTGKVKELICLRRS